MAAITHRYRNQADRVGEQDNGRESVPQCVHCPSNNVPSPNRSELGACPITLTESVVAKTVSDSQGSPNSREL
jgi:hypothetical protein